MSTIITNEYSVICWLGNINLCKWWRVQIPIQTSFKAQTKHPTTKLIHIVYALLLLIYDGIFLSLFPL